jgi:hypothetical protein
MSFQIVREKENQYDSIPFAIGILKIELFFSIAALAGYVYEGKESSPIYLIAMIGLGMLNMAIVFISIIKHKQYSLKASS